MKTNENPGKSDSLFDLSAEQAELWAMFYGFNDAKDLKKWTVSTERERLDVPSKGREKKRAK